MSGPLLDNNFESIGPSLFDGDDPPDPPEPTHGRRLDV
jgi:hypothetical protein